MRHRPIPSGTTGLIVLAVAAVPLVLSRCKPLAKRVGEKLVSWGEELKKEAEKPDSEMVVAKVADSEEPAQVTEAEAPVEIVEDKTAKSTATVTAKPKPKAAPKKTAASKPKTAAKKAPPKKPAS